MNLGKSVNVFGKSVPIALIALAVLAIPATAAVLDYYGQITGTAHVKQSLVVDGSQWTLDDQTAGSSQMMLVGFTNNAEVPVIADFELRVKKDGNYISNTDGLYLAISEDVNYWFKDKGDTSGTTGDGDGFNGSVNDWQDWMYENPAWVDWAISTDSVGDNYKEIIEVDDVGTSESPPEDLGDASEGKGLMGENGVMTIPDKTIPAGETVHGVLWVGTSTGLEPGDYTVELTADIPA